MSVFWENFVRSFSFPICSLLVMFIYYVEITSRRRLTSYQRWIKVILSTLIQRFQRNTNGEATLFSVDECSFDINCLIRLFIVTSTNKTKEIGALIISILRILLIVLQQVTFELIWCTVVYLFSFLFLFVLCTYFRQVMWPRSMVLLSKLMKIFQSLTSFGKFFVFSSNVPLFPIL